MGKPAPFPGVNVSAPPRELTATWAGRLFLLAGVISTYVR
jgi:hypothetical protein